MGQINIKKVASHLVPPNGSKGYGFNSQGQPIMINEDGTTTVLAAGNNEYIDVADIEPFDSLASYTSGQFVSYGGLIYLCVEDTTVGQSPETHPDKWESQGTQIGAIENIVYTNTIQTITNQKHFRDRLLLQQATSISSTQNVVLPKGNFFKFTDNVNPIQTINNNNWTGGSLVVLGLLTGQVIEYNHADYGLGNYNGIILSAGQNWTAGKDTLIILCYDRLLHKWIEIGGTTIVSGVPSSVNLDVVEVTDPVFTVTAGDIQTGTMTRTLRHAIAPGTHVFVYLKGKPLSIGVINSQDVEAPGVPKGSVSYTEGTRQISIDLNNTEDFGVGENKTKIIPGWPLVVRYSKLNIVTEPPASSNVTITSMTSSVSAQNVLSWVIELTNTGVTENLQATFMLKDENLNIVDTYTTDIIVTNGVVDINSNQYSNLPAMDYTLTITLNNGQEGTDTETIPEPEASFAFGDLTFSRTKEDEIWAYQSVINDGAIDGTIDIYFQLDSGALYVVSILIAKGTTVNVVYIFTGVSTSSHTINTYEDALGTIPIDDCIVPAVETNIGSLYNTITEGRRIDDVFKFATNTYVRGNSATDNASPTSPSSSLFILFGYHVMDSGTNISQSYNFTRIPVPTGVIGITDVKLRQVIDLNYLTYPQAVNNLQMFKVTGNIAVVDDATLRAEISSGYSINLIDSIQLINDVIEMTLNAAGIAYFEDNSDGYIDVVFRINGIYVRENWALITYPSSRTGYEITHV